jgi:DNA repair protein RadC
MHDTTPTLRELTIRYAVKQDHAGQPIAIGHALTTPRAAADLLLPLLSDEASEVFVILLLSTKHRVLAYHEVSRGTLDGTLVHPREVFKAALLANAAAVVLAHVHPSGDPSPSREDLDLTRRLGGHVAGRRGARSHHRRTRAVCEPQRAWPAVTLERQAWVRSSHRGG